MSTAGGMVRDDLLAAARSAAAWAAVGLLFVLTVVGALAGAVWLAAVDLPRTLNERRGGRAG